jgi:hypothetical protein
MTRDAAVRQLQTLTGGLTSSDASVTRLLERVSQADEPEALRALLAEAGARAVLAETNATSSPRRP